LKEAKKKQNLIFICTGKDCKKKDCEVLKSDLKKTIKDSSIKNTRLIKTKCMDYCKLGPNIAINNSIYHDCHGKDIPTLLEKLSE
jgi:NADH-quinone oxidoreductase subunit F